MMDKNVERVLRLKKSLETLKAQLNKLVIHEQQEENLHLKVLMSYLEDQDQQLVNMIEDVKDGMKVEQFAQQMDVFLTDAEKAIGHKYISGLLTCMVCRQKYFENLQDPLYKAVSISFDMSKGYSIVLTAHPSTGRRELKQQTVRIVLQL
jgi:hypothetical protein